MSEPTRFKEVSGAWEFNSSSLQAWDANRKAFRNAARRMNVLRYYSVETLESRRLLSVATGQIYEATVDGTIGQYSTSGATIRASLIPGLGEPQGIAISGSDLFVANYGNGTIGEYTTSGATVNASLISGLNSPYGLAVSGSDLFVANYGSGTIGEYTTSGATVNASLILGLNQPQGLAVSGSDLFVANSGNNTIGEYTTSGAAVHASLISGLNGPSGVAILASDLFIENSNGFSTIGEYTTSGATVNASLISGLADPSGIAISGANLFVTNYIYNTIDEYTTSGTTVKISLVDYNSGLGGPEGIAISGSSLFVANNDNNTIGEYTTSGATVNASLISGLRRPEGLAISGSDLFVANEESGTIGEYTTSGATVNASLISGLTYPYGLAISGADLFVANGDTIGEYTTSGATVNASLITGLGGAAGLTISGSDLFVAETGSNKIGEYTTSGATVNASLISGLNVPRGLAISGSDLFVANYMDNTIGEYTTSGGTVNASLISTPAPPDGIAISGSNLFIANSFNAIGEYTTSGGTVNASLITSVNYPLAIAVNASLSPVAFSASVSPDGVYMFNVTVSSASPDGVTPTGVVDFVENGTSIGSALLQSDGTAVFTPDTLPLGNGNVIATYEGDANNESGSQVAAVNVFPASVTSLQTSAATSTVGSLLALTVGVAGAGGGGPTPTGTVSFFSGTTSLGFPVALLNGTVAVPVITLPLGIDAITADYSGDSNYAPSVSATVSVTVTAAVTVTPTIFAPDVAPASGAPMSTSETISVDYAGAVAPIDQATIAAGNITIMDPAGIMLDETGTPTVTVAGNSALVMYTFAAPSGGFVRGTYVVSLAANVVKDTMGNAAPQDSGSFSVNSIEDGGFVAGSGNLTLNFSTEQVLNDSAGILAIGYEGDPASGTARGVLEQLTADGTSTAATAAFGSDGDGTVLTALGDNDAFYSAALDLSGNIVVAGSDGSDFIVARYTAAGAPDTSFGTGGIATIGFAGSMTATAYSVAIQPKTGAIVVAGGISGGTLALAQLTTAGALDTSFNPGGADDPTHPAGGQRTIGSSGALGAISKILIDDQSRIVGVGPDGAGIVVLRLNADGSNDDTFGLAGMTAITKLVSINAQQRLNTEDVAFQPGGDLLVGGQTTGGALGVVRLTAGGVVDTTFGIGGIAIATLGGSEEDATSVVVNPDTSEFVLIGTSTDANNLVQSAIGAFNANGSPNTSFGNSGVEALPAPQPPANTSSAHTRSFHPQNIDLITGANQLNNAVLVGASNGSQSALRRLKIVGINSLTPVPIGPKPNAHLKPFTLANGTTVTITIQGGSGTVSESPALNAVQLDITDGKSPVVTIHTHGGANSVTLSQVSSTASLHALMAPTAILTGTATLNGLAGTIHLASISGELRTIGSLTSLTTGAVSGAIACGGVLSAKVGAVSGTIAALEIRQLMADSLVGATILAGTTLGTPATDSSAATPNTYAGGSILSLLVKGAINLSFVGAGVSPGSDGIFADSDDAVVGTGLIRSILVHGTIDSASHFETAAGGFAKTARLANKVVKPASNANFITIP